MAMLKNLSLIQRIMLGMIVGVILGLTVPQFSGIGIVGDLFVGALKALAPVLVCLIVMSALSQQREGGKTNMRRVIVLYAIGTFGASLIAVMVSFIFPIKLILTESTANITPPQGIAEVLKTLLMRLVDNPINALVTANYIGILFWAVVFGIALRQASETTKNVLVHLSDATSQAVKWVISFAPVGIMGLVFTTVSTNGFDIFKSYGYLIVILVGTMCFVALVVNPIIVFIALRQNPYPLVLKCLEDSGITAFFTRSSAANIPVNMALCEELGLDEEMYSVSIPLGATVNMAGAAITISILTLAAANTLGIQVDFVTALILSVLAAVSAAGASGVAGGSLLLIPVAASLFGIPNDVAMSVVGVGFIIGIIQDSCETALNSSTDALFTAVAEFVDWKKENRPIWPNK